MSSEAITFICVYFGLAILCFPLSEWRIARFHRKQRVEKLTKAGQQK